MSTDKTLATAKHGGCVQLGTSAAHVLVNAEHLERILVAADANHFDDCMADKNTTMTQAIEQMRAALSAQPSPGGQDGPAYEGHTWISDYVLASLRERAALPLQLRNGEVWHWQGDGYDFPDSLVCPVVMSAETLRELIAARQPVGEPEIWVSPGQLEELKRRPAGQGSNYLPTRLASEGNFTQPLYAAPPAQAVDLGEMPEGWRLSKKATCYQLSHGNDIIGNLVGPDAEENAAIIARVLDSQAVGNG